jgi:hypothetical protein
VANRTCGNSSRGATAVASHDAFVVYLANKADCGLFGGLPLVRVKTFLNPKTVGIGEKSKNTLWHHWVILVVVR